MYTLKRAKLPEGILHLERYRMKQHQKGPVEYLTFPALEETGIVEHLFSTRVGGVSDGIYRSLNFHYEMGDRRENVDENYRRIADVLGHGRTLDDFVLGQQTHTTNVRVVTEKDRGKGVTRKRDYRDVDGLVTNVPGLILTTFHADCTPLYFVDVRHRAIGLSHSGWRGTVGRMGQKTLELMNRQYGTDPSECLCAIGPSICGDCYEVGTDVIDAFRREFDTPGMFLTEQYSIYQQHGKDKFLLDLWKANKMVLMEAGVPEENISVTDICTKCNSDYLFSHRITGFQRGTCAAFLCLKYHENLKNSSDKSES